jgi:hypothetical protein
VFCNDEHLPVFGSELKSIRQQIAQNVLEAVGGKIHDEFGGFRKKLQPDFLGKGVRMVRICQHFCKIVIGY